MASPNVLPCTDFVPCPCCSWVGLGLQTWQLLAIHCPNLRQLTIGFEGGEESVYDSASFYSSQLTDLSLQIVGQCCPKLRWATQQLRVHLSRRDVHCCVELHQRGAVQQRGWLKLCALPRNACKLLAPDLCGMRVQVL